MNCYSGVPPGDVLRIKLKKFRMTIDELANRTKLDKDWLYLITKDAMPIVPHIANRLEKIFNIRAKDWLLMEKEWLKYQANKDGGN